MAGSKRMTVKPRLQKKFFKMLAMNKDAYGSGVLEAATDAANLIDAGASMQDAQKGFNGKGLTGFMAGCAAEIVSTFHPKGIEFKRAWNARYKVQSKKAVNPALVTVRG